MTVASVSEKTRPTPVDVDDKPLLSWGEHMVTCALATWMLFGLYIDGWAHRNRNLHDSIKTPWHGIFYAGWFAFASWLVWLALREYRSGRPVSKSAAKGYDVGLIGVGMFMVGGICDQIWHTLWGVEQDLNAFMSPTHWLLAIGMFLMVSSPF